MWFLWATTERTGCQLDQTEQPIRIAHANKAHLLSERLYNVHGKFIAVWNGCRKELWAL